MAYFKLWDSSNFFSSYRDPWELSLASENLKMRKILQSVDWGRDLQWKDIWWGSVIFGCISISNGNQKQKLSTASQSPQNRFQVWQPCFLAPLPLCGVFFRLYGREKRRWGQGSLPFLEPYCPHAEVVLEKSKLGLLWWPSVEFNVKHTSNNTEYYHREWMFCAVALAFVFSKDCTEVLWWVKF